MMLLLLKLFVRSWESFTADDINVILSFELKALLKSHKAVEQRLKEGRSKRYCWLFWWVLWLHLTFPLSLTDVHNAHFLCPSSSPTFWFSFWVKQKSIQMKQPSIWQTTLLVGSSVLSDEKALSVTYSLNMVEESDSVADFSCEDKPMCCNKIYGRRALKLFLSVGRQQSSIWCHQFPFYLSFWVTVPLLSLKPVVPYSYLMCLFHFFEELF